MDDTHVGDIHGALRTIRTHHTVPRGIVELDRQARCTFFPAKAGAPRVANETPELDEPRKPGSHFGWPLLCTTSGRLVVRETIRKPCCAYARSRNSIRLILPVSVFGSSATNSMRRG